MLIDGQVCRTMLQHFRARSFLTRSTSPPSINACMSTTQPIAIATKRFAPPSSANPGPAPGQYEVRPLDKPRGVLPLGKQSKNRFEVCKVVARALLSACCQIGMTIFRLEVPRPHYTCTVLTRISCSPRKSCSCVQSDVAASSDATHKRTVSTFYALGKQIFTGGKSRTPATTRRPTTSGLTSEHNLRVSQRTLPPSDDITATTVRRTDCKERCAAGAWTGELRREGRGAARKGSLAEEHYGQLAGSIHGPERAEFEQPRSRVLRHGDGVRESVEAGGCLHG